MGADMVVANTGKQKLTLNSNWRNTDFTKSPCL